MPRKVHATASAGLVGAKPCPLRTAALTVSVVRATDGKPLKDFALKLDSKRGKTNALGLVEFTKLKPGTYTLNAGKINHKRLTIIEGLPQQVTVQSGSTRVTAKVNELVAVSVTVVDGMHPDTPIEGVRTSIDHPSLGGQSRVLAAGDTYLVAAGAQHTVSAVLTKELQKRYSVGESVRLTPTSDPAAKATNKVVVPLIVDPVRVHLRLAWKDPAGAERPFPEGFTAKLRFADRSTQQVRVGRNGRLVGGDSQDGVAVARARGAFKLDFTQADANFVCCEKPGEKAEVWLAKDATPARPGPVQTAIEEGQRAFLLPTKEWTTANSPWTVAGYTHYAAHEFKELADKAKSPSVGTPSAPVTVTLSPVWEFARFTYFDRFTKADAPVSSLPVLLEGFLAADEVEAQDKLGDAAAAWVEGDAATGVQCLPWLLIAGGETKPAATRQLRFRTRDLTFVKTLDDGSRVFDVGNPHDKPSVDRLRFYDLPALWLSRTYFGAIGTKKARFEALAADVTSLATPLTFCLDDLVLTDHTLAPVAWTPADRCAIFWHRFSNKRADGTDRADVSVHGVYKPDTTKFEPFRTKQPAATEIEKDRNYISDYPAWTRLVVAQGNVFDVFAARVPAKTGEPTRVVGARAAVRWIDATDKLPGTRAYSYTTGAVTPDGKPKPGLAIFDETTFEGGLTPAIKRPFLQIQPFWHQRYTPRFEPYEKTKDSAIGRVDLVSVRLCDVEGDTEQATMLQYLRLFFDWKPGATPTQAGGKPEWEAATITNVEARWNGAPGEAYNTKPTTFVSSDPLQPVKSRVLRFSQTTPEEHAHFKVDVTNTSGRDWRSSQGTGICFVDNYEDATGNFFTTAHENGHEEGLPDEYNERWAKWSADMPGFGQTLPGDVYEPDGRANRNTSAGSAMMNGVQALRARYYWPYAEWFRQVTGVPVKVMRDTHTYVVPPHEDAKRTYTFWPIEAALNQKPAAPAGLTKSRSTFDAYLYALGEDEWTTKLLPAKDAAATKVKYDGILTIVLKVVVNAQSPADKEDTYARLDAFDKGLAKLNHQYFVTGWVRAGTKQAWEFKRCLLDFRVRYLVLPASTASDHGEAQAFATSHGTHFTGDFKDGPANLRTWTDPAPATPPPRALPTAAEWDTLVQGALNLDARYRAELVKIDAGPREYKALQAIDAILALPVAGAELPTAADLDRVAATRAVTTGLEAIRTHFEQYHALAADDLDGRIAKLRATKGTVDGVFASQGPEIDTLGLWSHPTTDARGRLPGPVGRIDALIREYGALPAAQVPPRVEKLKALDAALSAWQQDTRTHPQAPDFWKAHLTTAATFQTAVVEKLAKLQCCFIAGWCGFQVETRLGTIGPALLRKLATAQRPALVAVLESSSFAFATNSNARITAQAGDTLAHMLGFYGGLAEITADKLKARLGGLNVLGLVVTKIA